MALRRRLTSRRPSLGVRRTGFKKAVTKIAKRVVANQTETKTGSIAAGTTFGTTGALIDVWGGLAKGTDQNQRVGDEVHALGMRIRAKIGQDPAIITALQDYNSVRMMVVVGKRPLTAADFPSMFGGIDPEVMTVLRDQYVNFATTKRQRHISLYVKLNRKVKWDSAGSITHNPIYIFLRGEGGTGLLAGSGDIFSHDVQRFYKDP